MQRTIESRRFSAVLLTHPGWGDPARDLAARWQGLTGDRVDQATEVTKWMSCEAKHISPKNFYSPSLAEESELKTSGGFIHDVLLAAPASGADDFVFIAAPYVYFLQDLLRTVQARLDQPRPYYQVVDLARAFRELADPPSELVRVRQFSVQRRFSSSADRLSVSGRNPLRSDLGQEFALNAGDSAYGLRIEAGFYPGFKTNVNFDRHGNYWWFHRGEGSLRNVLQTLDLLRRGGYFKAVRSIPPDHKEDE